MNETIEIFEIEDDVDPQGDLNEKNFDKLSHYSRRQISSAHSQRPTTAALTSAKWLEQRPPSAAIKVAPVQAYTGLSEPVKPKDNVEFESNYVNYKPLGGEAEKQMEKRYQTFRNRDLSEKRLRDEMNQKVHRWVSVRARRAEEQARRSESVRFASKFEQRAYSPSRNDTSASLLGKASYIDFTDELGVTVDNSSKDKIPETALDEYIPIHKMNKVSTIRKLHGEMIDAEASDETLLQDPSAIILSAYPQSTISSWIKKEPIRPLTAGSLPAPRSTSLRGIPRPGTATSQTRQVEELLEVKRRLASHNIPCSLEAMKYALLTPEDLPLDQLTNLCLPKPGSGLLLNPFIKIGKKKKKKKGKKGKKGKKAK